MKPSSPTAEYRENPVFLELVSILGNGFLLSLFNIDFLFFEYLFTFLGSGIMLYGCFLIKNHNQDFLTVYYLAFGRYILILLNFLLDWTSINTNPYVAYIQITISGILVILLFIHLDKGFHSMYRDAGIRTYPHRLFKYIFLYLCNLASTFLTIRFGIIGAIISILILLLNVLYIILAFRDIGKTLTTSTLDIELDSYGTERVRRHVLFIISYLVLLTFIIYFSNKGALVTTRTPENNVEISEELQKTKKNLISLGMNKSIVEDLALKEYEYLATAYDIDTQTNVHNANGGVIRFTIYRVKLANAERIIVHYQWIEVPGNRLFQIVEYSKGSLHNIHELTSRCLYNEVDISTSMEIPSVVTSINLAGNPYTNQKLSNFGDSLRGYLSFSYINPDTYNFPFKEMQIDLYYQVSIFNLPYLLIDDYMNYYDQYSTSIVYNRLTVPITKLFD